jgi:hypothetical protein
VEDFGFYNEFAEDLRLSDVTVTLPLSELLPTFEG